MSAGAGKGCSIPTCELWQPNPDPLQGQYSFLATEQSLWPQFSTLPSQVLGIIGVKHHAWLWK